MLLLSSIAGVLPVQDDVSIPHSLIDKAEAPPLPPCCTAVLFLLPSLYAVMTAVLFLLPSLHAIMTAALLLFLFPSHLIPSKQWVTMPGSSTWFVFEASCTEECSCYVIYAISSLRYEIDSFCIISKAVKSHRPQVPERLHKHPICQ